MVHCWVSRRQLCLWSQPCKRAVEGDAGRVNAVISHTSRKLFVSQSFCRIRLQGLSITEPCGEFYAGNVSSFKGKHERKCVSSSALAVKSSLAGRFSIWPLWLPASFISSSLTAYLSSCHALKSVTPRSTMTRAGCDPGLPSCGARQLLEKLHFQSLWTICWCCVQRRAGSVARPVVTGCGVISSLKQSQSSIPSKCLQLQLVLWTFFPLHIWNPMVKFILQFYSGAPLNHVLV